jgi:hypothetical protein
MVYKAIKMIRGLIIQNGVKNEGNISVGIDILY